MKPAIISQTEAMWSSGLGHAILALYAQPRHVLAQLGERLLVQEAGEIVGAVGNELAARQTDEEVVGIPPPRSRQCCLPQTRANVLTARPSSAVVAAQASGALEIMRGWGDDRKRASRR